MRGAEPHALFLGSRGAMGGIWGRRGGAVLAVVQRARCCARGTRARDGAGGDGGKTAGDSNSRLEVDGGVGKMLNGRLLGRFGRENGACAAVEVRGDGGVGVVFLWWRGGHKPHGKVAGKGNALILSRVN